MKFKHSKENYPELYLSDKLTGFLKETPKLPKSPTEPTKPQRPIEPPKEDTHFFGGMSLFIIVMVVLLISQWDKFDGGTLIVIIPLLFIVGIICIPLFIGLNRSNNEEYPQKMREYKEALERYPSEEAKYQRALVEYQQKMNDYNNLINSLMSHSNLTVFRKKLILGYLTQNEYPTFKKNDNSDIVKTGASENFFFEYLSKISNAEILVNHKTPIYNKYYYPDFILLISGICIDIEIDEPYSGKNGEPIHYLDSDYGIWTSVDKERNDFFTHNNWVVIRFAEEQVFKFPELCISFIESVVNSIIQADMSLITINDYFKVKKWTKEVSHQLAYKRYRHSYVPQRHQCLIDVEDWSDNDESIKDISSLNDFYDEDLPF